MRLGKIAAVACMFCLPSEPPEEGKVALEVMTKKDQLAHDYVVKVFGAYTATIPSAVSSEKLAFVAGFEAGRERAAKRVDLGFERGDAVGDILLDLSNLGEEESE